MTLGYDDSARSATTSQMGPDQLVEIARELAPRFAATAPIHDRENRFPFEHFAELHRTGYLAATVPVEYGGGGVDSLTLARAQEQLAMGDGSTALAATMHLGLLGRLSETRPWPKATFARVCRDVVERGALINAAHSEPALGSPSRGGLPSTTAVWTPGGWRIDGHKSWTSLAPALTYIHLLAAAVEPGREPRREYFLLPANTPGVEIVETWDNLGMRGTASHDVVLRDVLLPHDALVQDDPTRPIPGGGREWGLLAGQAVFLGLAGAARDLAVDYARTRRPNGMSGPIAELQTVQHRIAQIELLLLQARTLFYDIAVRWREQPEEREGMGWQLAALKHTVSNHAIQVGALALRVTGAAGLSRSTPLERIVRDLQVSIGQPPIDDAALTLIGKTALGLQ